MISGQRILAVITARGGSKRLPRKNVRDAGGKPLIAWSIEAGQGSTYVDRLILSSDDPEIINVAKRWGCDAPFVRPGHLAEDDSKVEDALIHALDTLEGKYDYLVLLQPTSPLRVAADIDDAIVGCHGAGAPACITVCEAAKSPYWMFTIDEKGRLYRFLDTGAMPNRRQELPPVYMPNGAVYVLNVPAFRSSASIYGPGAVACVMPPERSIDVDTEIDLCLADLYLRKRQQASPARRVGPES